MILILNLEMYEARCKCGEGVFIFWGGGYGCSAGNFDKNQIAKLQKNQICNPYSNKIFCFTSQSINFRTTFKHFCDQSLN